MLRSATFACALVFALAQPAAAATLTYVLDDDISSLSNMPGTAPWYIGVLEDGTLDGQDGVYLTLTAPGLAAGNYLTEWELNLVESVSLGNLDAASVDALAASGSVTAFENFEGKNLLIEFDQADGFTAGSSAQWFLWLYGDTVLTAADFIASDAYGGYTKAIVGGFDGGILIPYVADTDGPDTAAVPEPAT
jgi:hypothetical protein